MVFLEVESEGYSTLYLGKIAGYDHDFIELKPYGKARSDIGITSEETLMEQAEKDLNIKLHGGLLEAILLGRRQVTSIKDTEHDLEDYKRKDLL